MNSLLNKANIQASRRLAYPVSQGAIVTSTATATTSTIQSRSYKTKTPKPGPGVSPTEMPYHHFHKGPKYPNPKFKSPRKLGNIMMNEITQETVAKSKAKSPKVFDVNFRPGDAIELVMIAQGGVKSTETEKVRGVVLGKVNRGLGSAVYLRDVVFGEPVDRKIPLHSPLIKSIKVLEENFVKKGKKKIKRAKLFYLRDRPSDETRVTKW